MKTKSKSALIKLIKKPNGYSWENMKTKDVVENTKYNAIAFGSWWLKFDKKTIEQVMEFMDQEKHNVAFFSTTGDFLYVDNIKGDV